MKKSDKFYIQNVFACKSMGESSKIIDVSFFNDCINCILRKKLTKSFVWCVTSALPWNYIWKPGKYSEKDHNKIAEKYDMHPKEYKPFSDKEACVGDYPDIPMVGPAAKDPYYPYDMPVYKKNYHEMVNLYVYKMFLNYTS